MKNVFLRDTCVLFIFVFASVVIGAPYPFDDDFESGPGNWNTNGLWGITALSSYSPTRSLTDSPGRFYTNNTDQSAWLSSSVDLSSATNPALRFYHRYNLEPGYDFATAEISTNDGLAWESSALGLYNGQQAYWTREQCDLSAYAGMSDVRIRFRVTSDSSVVQDGWYVDDVRIAETPGFGGLTNLTAEGPHRVLIEWAPGDGSVSGYRILRTHALPFEWRTAHTVASVGLTNRFRDYSVSPKTRYYYAVMAVNAENIHTLSVTQSVLTPAGMDYPFLDDGEGGGATWNASLPWALDTEYSVSPTHAWTDSPGRLYSNSINTSLTLAEGMDLTSAQNPALCFAYRHDFNSGDSGNIEVSVNGSDWPNLQQVTGNSAGQWKKSRIDLSAYTNETEVLIRFRITTDASAPADGWFLDNIGVGDSPDELTGPIISEVASHSMRLTWAECAHPHFARYEVYRSTSTGVDFNDTLVAAVSNRSSTTVVVSNLALNTEYFYRVYAVTVYGVYSPDGTETGDTTLNHPLPFADGFDSGLTGWNLTGSWGLQTNDPQNGMYCLSDSPGNATYSNSHDTTATTAFDLTGITWPVLTFHDRFSIAAGDWGFIEVSTDGNDWFRLYAAQGTQTNWVRQRIDLTDYRGQANLRLRFHFTTDGSETADGWNIDSVSVEEHVPQTIAYPFYEGFENGLTNWLDGIWQISASDPYAGSNCVHDTVAGNRPNEDYFFYLSLAGPIDLSEPDDPQIVFYEKYTVSRNTDFHLYATKDDGVNWTSLSGNMSQSGSWTRRQYSLSAFRTNNVRLRFRICSYPWDWSGDDAFIDSIVIDELPTPVTLDTTPHLKSIDLNWTKSDLTNGFARYEVYQATSAGVDPADTLIGSVTDMDTTNMTATGLEIGRMYYYKVYVVHSNGVYSGSGERSDETVPMIPPVSDDFDNTDNWYTTGHWGLTAVNPHTSSNCLTDSPVGDYADSSDSYALTAVNLSGFSWPVLTFYDRFDIAPGGDWGWVEVSTDGNNWFRIYEAQGEQSDWTLQRIDLADYRNVSNLRIRFRLASDGSTTAEGWFIDGIRIREHAPQTVPFPFSDGFEAGLTNWLDGVWTISQTDPYSGSNCIYDTVAGNRPSEDYFYYLSLAGPLDLSAAADPQAVFYTKYSVSRNTDFNLYATKDDGANWTSVSGSMGQSGSWTRRQYSLSAFRTNNVRLRFRIYSAPWDWSGDDAFIDRFVVEDMPTPVTLDTTPHLKSIDLNWTKSDLTNGFARYEVYQSTSAGVDPADTLIESITDLDTTNMTATGLEIGRMYYYKVYVVNSNGVYSGSGERSDETVPMIPPVSDDFDNTDNWYTTGHWGLTAVNPHTSSNCLTDSPVGDYADSSDSYALTAVNLSGFSWPALTFYDRFDIAPGGDWGWVEVSTDGNNWFRIYEAQGEQSDWTLQRIDLADYRNVSNLRIRFRLASDGSTTAEGWFIDGIRIREHAPQTVPFPFSDGFEAGLTNWLDGVWTISQTDPYSGSNCVHDTLAGNRPTEDYFYYLSLAGPLDLSAAADPQAVFYTKYSVSRNTDFNLYATKDDGANWTSVSGSMGQSGSWTRRQYSLSAFRTNNVRLRFRIYSAPWDWSGDDAFIDRFVVEDMPTPVVLDADPHATSVDLQWTASTLGTDFLRYEVYRATHSTVTPSDTRLITITNIAVTNFTSAGLEVGKTYYFKVFTVNSNHLYAPSNEKETQTVPHALPLTDDMENLDNWYATGSWSSYGVNPFQGSNSITDSPVGDYAVSSDSYIMTAVNCSGIDWPVLTFYDRFDIAPGGDWAWVEVSTDGNDWIRVYEAQDTQSDWTLQRIDLIDYKHAANLRIRFRLASDGSTVRDGWFIDNLEIKDHEAQAIPFPLYEGFENGLTNWLDGTWTISASNPYEGSNCMHDTRSGYNRPTENYLYYLTLAGPLDMSDASDPSIVFYMKFTVSRNTELRLYASANGGSTWTDVAGSIAQSASWIRREYNLSAFRTNNVLLRFRVYSAPWDWSNDDAFIDHIMIGDPAPGVPVLSAPENYESVAVLRPNLVVTNALDYQGDALDYAFEIYSDAALSNLVASVPVVASGADTTSWTVDTDLTDGLQYWWRCRADDGVNTGLWMNVATFYVNHANSAPNRVELLGPPPASILRDDTYTLSWLKTEDPDFGDIVEAYHLQIDTSEQFTNPVVDDATITLSGASSGTIWAVYMPLSAFSGSGGLQDNTGYVWRMRAKDQWDAWSAWSTNDLWFVFGTPPPSMGKMAMLPGGKIDMSWARSGARTVIEFTPSLDDPDWQEVTGATIQTNGTVDIPPAYDTGFFRVRTVD